MPVDIPEEMLAAVIRPEFADLPWICTFLTAPRQHRFPWSCTHIREGFFTGIKQMGPWRFLLEAGVAVVSVQYRLSGEAVFPDAIHDVAAAVRWVRANADRYGLDAERIVGFGSSAGAYLISAVALAGDGSDLVGSTEP